MCTSVFISAHSTALRTIHALHISQPRATQPSPCRSQAVISHATADDAARVTTKLSASFATVEDTNTILDLQVVEPPTVREEVIMIIITAASPPSVPLVLPGTVAAGLSSSNNTDIIIMIAVRQSPAAYLPQPPPPARQYTCLPIHGAHYVAHPARMVRCRLASQCGGMIAILAIACVGWHNLKQNAEEADKSRANRAEAAITAAARRGGADEESSIDSRLDAERHAACDQEACDQAAIYDQAAYWPSLLPSPCKSPQSALQVRQGQRLPLPAALPRPTAELCARDGGGAPPGGISRADTWPEVAAHNNARACTKPSPSASSSSHPSSPKEAPQFSDGLSSSGVPLASPDQGASGVWKLPKSSKGGKATRAPQKMLVNGKTVNRVEASFRV